MVVGLDIETAPMEVYAFRLGKQQITLDHVKTHSSIISFSYQIRGEDKVHYHDTFDQDNPRDDRELCMKLWQILDEASVIVAQNGAAFDIPIIRYRMYINGLPPPSPFTVMDTLHMSRSIGKADSHKLAHLTAHLTEQKSKHSKFPGLELWTEFLAGNPEARAEMQDYNEQDVRSMMELFERMLPWAKNIPGANLVHPASADRPVCPRCGSHDVQPRGFTHTLGGTYQRYRCGSCGGWSQSRYTSRDRKVSRNTLKVS